MKTIDFVELVNATVEQIKLYASLLHINEYQFRIGGSLALMLQIPEFKRDIHDIDIIISCKNDIQLGEVRSSLNALNKIIRNFSDDKSEESLSYALNKVEIGCKKYTVNVIIQKPGWSGIRLNNIRMNNRTYFIQHPMIIRFAKIRYKRVKDDIDLNIINKWLFNNMPVFLM